MGTKPAAVNHTWRTNELEAGCPRLEPCDQKRAKRKLWKDKSKNRMYARETFTAELPTQFLIFFSATSLSTVPPSPSVSLVVLVSLGPDSPARVCRLRHLRTHIQGEMISIWLIYRVHSLLPNKASRLPSLIFSLCLSLSSIFLSLPLQRGTDRVLP